MTEAPFIPTDLSPLWISLKVSLLATVFTFFAGIAVAYWMLGYRGKGRSILEGVFVSPLILPPTVVGFLLLLLFGKNGTVGHWLGQFDLSLVFTWYGAVITATVVSFPLMYRTALGAFEQIDSSLLAVARTLGASERTVFFRVLFPLALPGVLAGATLAFARALGEFGATLMLAGNIPGQTQTIPMAIYFAVEAGAMHEAWFWAVVILLVSLSGIVAVNFWQEQAKGRRQKKRQKAKGKRQKAEAGGADLRGFENLGGLESPSPLSLSSPLPSLRSPFSVPPFSPSPPLPISPSPHSLSPLSVLPSCPPIPPSGLLVDIHKRLASFDLDLNLRVAESTLGILGGSGAGKSMLMRCIAGMETPDSGQIILNGRVLFDSHRGINLPSRDRRIGFLVQNYALFPNMSVADNIAFGLPSSLSASEIRQRVEAQLTAVQLQGYGDRYPYQLSGGQQQRVALARALASEPELLLLDEPFSALDSYLRSQMERQMLDRLRDFGGVSLFVTHNLEEAYRICQDLLVLQEGRAIACGSKHDIFERPGFFSVAQLTGCKNFSRAIQQTPQQVNALDWNCTLQVIETIPPALTHIGIRAHQILFLSHSPTLPLPPSSLSNTFPCWLASTVETPHRMTLYLKLHRPPIDAQDYHLEAEVFKEKWATLKDQPFPWFVRLDPLRLMVLQER
jgi:molybdate transport system permease protein